MDARLPDGSRVNAIIKPLAIDGPHLSIRKFRRDALSARICCATRALTEQMLELLNGVIKARLNVLISGGTGAGKTTLLNIMSSFIPSTERIVTIEDSAELQLRQPHVVRLETRPANIEGTGEVPQRMLLVNALRMRPDRIIMGECRGAEAVDMLQAMNTGHDGSLTTLHANTPRDALSRLETMIAMASLDLPEKAMRQQIASAIQVVIQVTRLGDGTRKVTNISEITGMEGDVITMQDIFVFDRQGVGDGGKVLGHFKATGIRPKFADRLKAYGIDLAAMLFSNLEPRPRAPERAPHDGLQPALEAMSMLAANRRCMPALLVFLAVAFGTSSLAWLVDLLQERQRRVGRAAPAARVRQQPAGRGAAGLLRGLEGQVPRWLAPLAARLPAFEDAQLMLEQAGSTHDAGALPGALGRSRRSRSASACSC